MEISNIYVCICICGGQQIDRTSADCDGRGWKLKENSNGYRGALQSSWVVNRKTGNKTGKLKTLEKPAAANMPSEVNLVAPVLQLAKAKKKNKQLGEKSKIKQINKYKCIAIYVYIHAYVYAINRQQLTNELRCDCCCRMPQIYTNKYWLVAQQTEYMPQTAGNKKVRGKIENAQHLRQNAKWICNMAESNTKKCKKNNFKAYEHI